MGLWNATLRLGRHVLKSAVADVIPVSILAPFTQMTAGRGIVHSEVRYEEALQQKLRI